MKRSSLRYLVTGLALTATVSVLGSQPRSMPALAQEHRCLLRGDTTAVITGTVRDEQTSRPIPFNLVRTTGTRRCADWTDSLGNFRFQARAGEHVVEAHGRQGFVTREQRVSLSGGDSVFLSFVLPRNPDVTGTPVAFTEGVPAAFWTEGFFYFSAFVIRDAGLPSLRTASFAEGVREVRFWSELYIGVPKHLVVIRDVRGRVTGEAIRYWPAGSIDEDDHLDEQLTEDLGSTCEQLLRGEDSTVCYGRFVSEPDWSRILREASKAGLWTLPDPSTLPDDSVRALDGWGMTVELRDGKTYRTYEYSNPDGHAWPEARQAEVLADIFGEVWQHVAPQEPPSPPDA